jgi:hypothetical protein
VDGWPAVLATPYLAGKKDSTACVEEKVGSNFPPGNPQSMSTAAHSLTVENSLVKACSRLPPTWYASTVYSTQELALKSVTDAIEHLDAVRRRAGAHDLEAQVAAVWAMVGEMDPGLAKVASLYANAAAEAPHTIA